MVTFKRGVHPPTTKDATADRPIEALPLPDLLAVPLSQHVGAPATPIKAKGDAVAVGEALTAPSTLISAAVHAPAAGTVKRIVDRPLPGGKMAQYMEITVDHAATEAHRFHVRFADGEVVPAGLDQSAVVKMMREAGIVGMGGATFPTDVKYTVPAGREIDTLILNGVECEPFITCDHRVMVEHAETLLSGCRVLHAVYRFREIVVGVEANKPDAIAALLNAAEAHADLPVRVVPLKVKYPQGAEKMLIFSTTGRVVPVGALPLDVGVVVSNVQTLHAIYEAVFFGKPVIDRILTVSGSGIAEPKNVRVAVGTPLEAVVAACGGLTDGVRKVVAGGPMTGTALPTLEYSVTKGSSAFLFFTDGDVQPESPCLRCGRCVDVCPMNLMPLKLAGFAKAGKFAEAKALDVNACFECGSCAFTCPAKINIVAWIRYAKNTIRTKRL